MGSITASLPANIPGGASSLYILLIIGGVLLGGMTIHQATRTAIQPAEEDPEPVVIQRKPLVTEEGPEGLLIKPTEDTPKPVIRPLRITSKQDIATVQSLLREGPHVLFLNISAVKNDADMLRQWLRIIEHTAKANEGKVLGIDGEHILATSGVHIVR